MLSASANIAPFSAPLSFPAQYPRHERALREAHGMHFGAGPEINLFGGDGLTFDDLIDTVNPLQQLPVVGWVYRGLTGDSISSFSRMAGGFLFGGPVGLVLAAATEGLGAITGGDIGEQALALLGGGEAKPAEAQYASAQYRKMYWLT